MQVSRRLGGGAHRLDDVVTNAINELLSYQQRFGLIDTPRESLARTIWDEVQAATGLSAALPPWQIVRERRATFAATPAQDARRQVAVQARTNAVNEARTKAQSQVQAAKTDIENDRAAAEAGLQDQVATLAQEIARRVLQPAGAGR